MSFVYRGSFLIMTAWIWTHRFFTLMIALVGLLNMHSYVTFQLIKGKLSINTVIKYYEYCENRNKTPTDNSTFSYQQLSTHGQSVIKTAFQPTFNTNQHWSSTLIFPEMIQLFPHRETSFSLPCKTGKTNGNTPRALGEWCVGKECARLWDAMWWCERVLF